MNISSILITILGIIIILALYVMSRVSKNNIPKKDITKLPDIKDTEGKLFTSVLDDIPSSDIKETAKDSVKISSLASDDKKSETKTVKA